MEMKLTPFVTVTTALESDQWNLHRELDGELGNVQLKLGMRGFVVDVLVSIFMHLVPARESTTPTPTP